MKFLLALTIPTVDFDAPYQNWNQPLLLLQSIVCPLFTVLVLHCKKKKIEIFLGYFMNLIIFYRRKLSYRLHNSIAFGGFFDQFRPNADFASIDVFENSAAIPRIFCLRRIFHVGPLDLRDCK